MCVVFRVCFGPPLWSWTTWPDERLEELRREMGGDTRRLRRGGADLPAPRPTGRLLGPRPRGAFDVPSRARPSRRRRLPRLRGNVAREPQGRRGCGAYRRFVCLGCRAGVPGDCHGLAGDEPARFTLLAAPRFSTIGPPALPIDPIAGRATKATNGRSSGVDSVSSAAAKGVSAKQLTSPS